MELSDILKNAEQAGTTFFAIQIHLESPKCESKELTQNVCNKVSEEARELGWSTEQIKLFEGKVYSAIVFVRKTHNAIQITQETQTTFVDNKSRSSGETEEEAPF